MWKRLTMILFSSFVGIFSNPELLMASDSVALTGLDNTGIVETIIFVPEPEPDPEPEPEPVYEEPVYEEPVYYYEPVYYTPYNNIQIAGRTIEVVDVDDTAINAGDHVNKYGDKFLYGHNSWSVFGGLVNLGAGDTFTMEYNGNVINYQIRQVVIYEKNDGRLQLNGSGSYMLSVSRAKYDGVEYDLSLMTCYGTSYGNGDASHRLVLFANAF